MEVATPLLPYWSWPVLAAAVSALLTEAAIRYARRRALFDQPGQRRMHTVPTPRGGGIGIVVAALAIAALLLIHHTVESPLLPIAVSVGLIAVASVGAWDDHRGLGALPRLVAHLFAAVIYVGAWGAALFKAAGIAEGGASLDAGTVMVATAVGVAAVLAIVWSINLHNFMDGINGILAIQTAFLFGSLALLAQHTSDLSVVFLCLAAACAAFVPFNFPRARVFMGDVGSGSLGLLVAATTICNEFLVAALILNSAFIVDTTATLISRFVRGKRWYSAHREHLYQWLARSDFSHAQVVGLYALWNLCIALPCALIFVHWRDLFAPQVSLSDHVQSLTALPGPPLWLVPAVLSLATLVWWRAKRWCLRRARQRVYSHGGVHAH